VREDYLEQLDKLFPDGYVIAYTCPNGTIRLGRYNPKTIEELDKLQEHILESGIWK